MFDNFDLVPTYLPDGHFGWKHFFGSFENRNAIRKSEDCAILSIVRNPIDYLVSFYYNPHHQPKERLTNFITFLSSPFYSVDGNNIDRKIDINIENESRYQDIFEMRSVKSRFLYSTIPTLTKNWYFMKYEDLKSAPENLLENITRKFELIPKTRRFMVEQRRVGPPSERNEFEFSNAPLMENYSIDSSDAKEIIKNRLDFEIEKLIGYDKNTIIMRLT